MRMEKLVVVYPPDYDGELHVTTKETTDAIGRTLGVSFVVRMQELETPAQCVRRIAADLARIRGRK